MKLKRTKLNKIVFYSILILLFAPMIQSFTKLISIKKLNGFFTKEVNIDFSKKDWFLEKYQKQKEKHINQNFGFRSSIVRLNNQKDFYLYRKLNANGIVIGKEYYLFEKNYIDAYYGNNFIGEKKIEEKVKMLKSLHAKFKEMGKELIVVFAPRKAAFYPEYIPDKYHTEKKTTNYEYYSKELNKHKIYFIDFHKWFIEQKNKSEYPLFPQTGIHWSKYGMTLAMDSIAKYIIKKTGKNLPTIKWNNIDIKNTPEKEDRDIERTLNLCISLNNKPLAYPEISFIKKDREYLKSIVVSDSFYWLMFNAGFSNHFFDNGKFWYYNKTIYPDTFDGEVKTENANLKAEIEKTDVVILISTDANLNKFAWGWIDNAYSEYFGENKKRKKQN